VVHLRCGFFFTSLLLNRAALEDGVLRIAMPVDTPMPWVDPRDIGDVAAARLLSTARGPEADRPRPDAAPAPSNSISPTPKGIRYRNGLLRGSPSTHVSRRRVPEWCA